MAKYKGIEIANFYVQMSNDLPETDITNLKLNKLCYYVQGWSLAKLGHPMFSDDIQAWKYGPVVPDVYHTYKVCGNNAIAEPADRFDESRLSTDELNLLIDVFMTYGKYSPGELVSMTHAAGGPWNQVYVEGENNRITNDILEKYFSESNELETLNLNATPENVKKYA